MLLEVPSSKESVVDDTNKSELVNEVSIEKTPAIENDSGIDIDSKENKEHVKEEVFHKHILHGLKTVSVKERKKYSLKDRLTGKHRNNQEH